MVYSNCERLNPATINKCAMSSSRDNQSSSNGDRRDDRRDDRDGGSGSGSSSRRDRSGERKDDRSSSRRDGGGDSRPPRDSLNGHQTTSDGRFSGTSARYEGKADGIEKRIFIGSLDGETSRDDKIIRAAFEQYGRIASLNVKKGFAFLVCAPTRSSSPSYHLVDLFFGGYGLNRSTSVKKKPRQLSKIWMVNV
jgi:hypothetical protein